MIRNGEGIVSFVTNNAFLDSLACDGVRKNLAEEFDEIRIVNLGGNVRKNPKLSGTTHNVFGIQVGVSVNFFVLHPSKSKARKGKAKIFYHALPTDWRRTEKYDWLEKTGDMQKVPWQEITPDKRYNWLQTGLREEFETFLPLGDREARGNNSKLPPIFGHYSRGVATARDAWAVNFEKKRLSANMQRTIEVYNAQVEAWHREKNRPVNVEDFVNYDSTKISWSRDLKNDLQRHRLGEFEQAKIRPSAYRPFTKEWLFFDRLLNEEVYGFSEIFPKAEVENIAICVGCYERKAFSVLAVAQIPDLNFYGDPAQCFPFYTYDARGTNRQENIPLSALVRFQSHYGDDKITRWTSFIMSMRCCIIRAIASASPQI